MHLPAPRGRFTESLFAGLTGHGDCAEARAVEPEPCSDDAALALWILYELHYRGLDEVDPSMEWDPEVLRVRQYLERRFESSLRAGFRAPVPGAFTERFLDWVEAQGGRSLADHVRRDADRDQVLDLLRVRSLYHLKESDPLAWLVPRLGVRAKAALVELQYDEYGCGDPNRLHHNLFAQGMLACGLTPEYQEHIDVVPGEVLRQNNAMSLFGLHRRLRGAALGHLAAFEATSAGPCRRIAQGLRRLDFPDAMVGYYEEHVAADAVHEQLAVRVICAALLSDEPQLEADVWFGAYTCLHLEDAVATAMLERWGLEETAA